LVALIPKPTCPSPIVPLICPKPIVVGSHCNVDEFHTTAWPPDGAAPDTARP
jgi:hypothetical protein